MKNLKSLKNLLLFVFLCLLIFIVGGCGGSSNRIVSQNPGNQENINENNEQNSEIDVGISGDVPAKTHDNPEVLRVLDKVFATDENGVPLIFDYAPLPESSDNIQNTNNTHMNFFKYVSSKDLDENGEFVKTFALNKNNEYIIKYSHSGRNLNGSYLKFRITAPEEQVMILDFIGGGEASSFDKELESQGVISKSIYVETKHEVIPEESPCIMIYSFNAPLTGNYTFAIREANAFSLISPDVDETKNNEFPFEFRFYTAGETYSAAGDEEKELSPRKILDLQRILLENATEFDENRLPINFKSNDTYGNNEESTTNNYLDSAYGVLDEVYGNSESDSENIIIAPRIDDIPYDSLYIPGSGFYAHSGLRSIQLTAFYDDIFSENAIEDFTIEKPQGDYTMKTNLNVDYVSTEEELLRLKGLDDLKDFTLLKDALANKTRDREQLGLAGSKTLFLRYEHYESKPRIPDMGELAIRSKVVNQLKNSFTDFQREHGDYFVAGYTYGIYYEAVIEIKVEPYNCYYIDLDGKKYSDAEAISSYIGHYIKTAFNNPPSYSVYLLNDLESRIKRNSKNVSVRVSYVSHSGTGSKTMLLSLSEFAQDFSDFRLRAWQVPSSDYERLYVTLIRYREIERVKKLIPEELPITAEHYRLIRELNKLIYLTRCYKNAVDSIPESHLNNGEATRIEWNNEFLEVFNLYNNQLNRLCSDINFVRDYYEKFNRLLEKYQALNHRYVFYRYFLAYQKSIRNGIANWTDSDEDWSYPRFKVGFSENDVATNRFIKQDFSYYKRGDKFGPYVISEWDRAKDTWEVGGTFFDSSRAYYYEGGPINTNNSDGTDMRGHTIGKRSFRWKFERGFLRRIECKVIYSMINMPVKLYPFIGLED